MNSDQALHHLNEVRANVDGDIAEYVDTIAQLVLLNQDIDSPMLGAKVTVYLDPPTESHSVPADEVPDDIDPDRDDVTYYSGYENDGEEMVRYRLKTDPEHPDAIPVEGLTFEGNVAESAPDGPLWDPNKDEYTVKEDYPMGTVNAAIPEQWEDGGIDALFSEGYCSSTEDRTSLVPHKGDGTETACYRPGWDDAQVFHLDRE
jgi:hypothetical protein